MVKAIKQTKGKQQIEAFYCPKCNGWTGEQQVGKDATCPLNHTKITQLCYKCGFSRSFYFQKPRRTSAHSMLRSSGLGR